MQGQTGTSCCRTPEQVDSQQTDRWEQGQDRPQTALTVPSLSGRSFMVSTFPGQHKHKCFMPPRGVQALVVCASTSAQRSVSDNAKECHSLSKLQSTRPSSSAYQHKEARVITSQAAVQVHTKECRQHCSDRTNIISHTQQQYERRQLAQQVNSCMQASQISSNGRATRLVASKQIRNGRACGQRVCYESCVLLCSPVVAMTLMLSIDSHKLTMMMWLRRLSI